jgi:hypothetical protein
VTFGVTVLGIRREARCEHASASEVSLRRSSVHNTALYERVLGCQPRFEMHEDRMLFDRRVASLGRVRCNADVPEKARVLAHELIADEP